MHRHVSGSRHYRVLLLGAAAPGFLLATSAAAQTTAAPPEGGEPVALNEIVVTAQRRSESIQNVPIAVTALSADRLESANVDSTLDLPKLTPSLQMSAVGSFAMPRIRGVGTSADGATIESPIAVYVDGVYYASETGAVLSLNNIEQIEVDKGPQGTLFGRNATGGLIQIKTRTPQDTFQGLASVSYENYQTAVGNLYVTGPIVNGLDADVALYYRNQSEGYGRDVLTGQEIDKRNDFVARSKWRYKAGDTDILFIADYAQSLGNTASSPAPGSTPLGGLIPLRDLDTAVPARLDNWNKQGGLSLRILQNFEAVTFSSTTAAREFRGFDTFPGVNTDIVDTIAPHISSRTAQVSQEFQVQSAGGPIQWTGGMFLFYSRGDYDPTEIVGIPLAPVTPIYHTKQDTYSGAVYGQGTLPLTDDTALTLGARYTEDQRKLKYNLTFQAPFPIPTQDADASKTFTKPTWRASLDHHFNKELLGYVSYNRGFKSGGFNDFANPVDAAANPGNPPQAYQPETIDAYEIGLKSMLLNDLLRVNVDSFYYDYKNIQVNRYVQGVEYLYNGASASVRGFEAEGSFRVTSRFSIDFGLSYLDGKYKSFENADVGTPLPGGGTLFGIGSATGHRLNYTPMWSGNVAATYTQPTSFGDARLVVSYYRTAGYFTTPDENLYQNGYGLLDANLTLENTDASWRLSLYGRNLTNALYAAFLYEEATGNAAQWAPPRTFGIKIERRF